MKGTFADTLQSESLGVVVRNSYSAVAVLGAHNPFSSEKFISMFFFRLSLKDDGMFLHFKEMMN